VLRQVSALPYRQQGTCRLTHFLKNRLVQDVLVLGGVQVSAYILPIVTLPYLTRVLGPEKFGLITIGTALVLYFQVITEYGFSVTGIRHIAVAQEDLPQVSRVYSSIMLCKLILMAACFLVMLGLLAFVPKLHDNWLLYLVSFLQVAGVCLSPNWLLQGMQRMKLVAYSDYGAKILSVALIFLLVRHSSDYLIAATLQSGVFLIAAMLGLMLTFRTFRLRLVWPSWQDMRTHLFEGWPVFLSMASTNVMSSSNTVILGMMTTPTQVGYLGAGSRLIIASRALTNPLASAVYPHMSRLAARSRQESIEFLERRLLWTTVPFLLISLGLLFFSPLAVRILYGPKYAETAVLLRLMSLTPFVHAINMCFGTYYMLAFGYEKAWSRIIIQMLFLNFVAVFGLMLVMPLVRAIALSTSLMDVFSAVSCIAFYWRTEKRKPKQNVEPQTTVSS
jgi:PST family polysaccharide transporter